MKITKFLKSNCYKNLVILACLILVLSSILLQIEYLKKETIKNNLYKELINNIENLNFCYILTSYNKDTDLLCLKKLGVISRQLDILPDVTNEGLIYGGTYRYLSALSLKNYPDLFDRLKIIAKNEKEIKSTDIDYYKLLDELRDNYQDRLKISRKRIK